MSSTRIRKVIGYNHEVDFFPEYKIKYLGVWKEIDMWSEPAWEAVDKYEYGSLDYAKLVIDLFLENIKRKNFKKVSSYINYP